MAADLPHPLDPFERPPVEAYRLLVESVVDYAIFMLDPLGRVVSWNPGAERIKGYLAEEIVGEHFSVFYPAEDLATRKPWHELEVAGEVGRFEDEGWRLRKDGSRFWANVVITALFDDGGGLRGFAKVTRDLTERRRAEQALVEQRRLVGHLVGAQELERRRIAWDVHDDSIQAMVAVGMRLQLLATRLPAEHAEVVRRLDEAVTGAVDRLRGLVFRLRPPEIDRHGLVEALDRYLADVTGPWELEYLLRHSLEREPPADAAITVFRICQEAVTNVHKHARATAVEITLATLDGGTLVEVADDGIGIGVLPDRSTSEHFGTVEMRERAETAGGWWSLTDRPDGGALVQFWVPTPGEAER